MKKFIKFLTTFLVIFSLCTLSACNYDYFQKAKDSDNYYFNKLAYNISICDNYKITLLDTNFYKTIELKEDDLSTLLNFLNSLKKENFIKEPMRLPEKPEYKIFLNLDKHKFVINVYNNQYASIFPWDGTCPMNFIDMKNIHKGYNLYNLCKYLIPKNTN